ncbi:MAG: SAM-dependent methyltransferase [Bacteroidia bacterium]|nr:MAG: SAM-dependent methyltransferase [Bacteroidia bacterium]
MSKGKIYLIPTTLGDSPINDVLPPKTIDILSQLQHFAVENIRTTRRYIKKVIPEKDINQITFHLLNKHTSISEIRHILQSVEQGIDLGIISEAGNPCIADPGSLLTREAHRNNLQIIPLTGPSSILLALISSGMNGQNFAFNGYLPISPQERIKKLRQLEKKSQSEQQPQIFMETPYRNKQMIESIIKTCHPETLLCIATNLTLSNEFIKTAPISYWKKHIPEIHKQPCIFIIGA